MIPSAGWKHFHHEADIGVHGWGTSPTAAFEQAAVAMTAVITDPQLVSPTHTIRIQCDAPDLELLLTDWLNAIVYEMATRKMLFSDFHVAIQDNHLQAVAAGELVDRQKHHPSVEVKGATYTELRVWQTPAGEWHAQCVVDV